MLWVYGRSKYCGNFYTLMYSLCYLQRDVPADGDAGSGCVDLRTPGVLR